MNTFEDFKNEVRGKVVQQGDDAYDEARSVYNGMIDRKPKYIVYCQDVGDVIAAVNFGRDNKIRTSIRGGGHNAAGLGVCDDGLVIDLSKINYTHINTEAKTVRVGGGATWGDVDHATNAFGLATPSGILSTTGVGGLTLGGGLGYLSRKCGLSIDNLLEAEMVLADGSFITVNKNTNEDLFWAIRGGGGNFGVVTSFKFKLHEIGTVYGGPMLWEIDQAEEILKWYREFIINAPHDINGFFAFLVVPPAEPFPEHLHNKTMCGIVWCYTGPLVNAENVFKPIREIENIALDFVGPLPYPALQSMFDVFYPKGMQWYWKADFVKEIPDKAVDIHVKYGSEIPTMYSTMHLYPINGKAQSRKQDETPWSYRDANWAQVMVGVSPDESDREAITQWTKNYWEDLHPYSSGGAYVNFMMDEGEERIKATYRDNYSRLAKIKATYDPENFFNVNQNIKPEVPKKEIAV